MPPVKTPQPFQFDEKVAAVFPDMIKRSVPGYNDIILQIQKLAGRFIKANSHAYDLGCSLGAASLAMSYGNQQHDVEIIGIDNSAAMLKQCQRNIDKFKLTTPISLQQEDILRVQFKSISMLVLNYTLQFIQPEQRLGLLNNIFDAMLPGAILLISEKIHFRDPKINQLMIELHHQFKRDNGYSELEISQKRSALEKVLLAETRDKHLQRLKEVGFNQVVCWHQQINFASFIAIKD
ncbi:MAG: carboxy-S-adenosyl-L-methionine synthase CmoA [Enterobacterales bacterium]|nr:carboxy-S-adenosyl-L-methionine synthase CmoA [Enterobacterales bacterium]